MHDGFVEQQDLGELFAGIGMTTMLGEVVQLLVQVCALGLNHAIRIRYPRRQTDHEFEKEFIVLMPGFDPASKPLFECFAAGRRERINSFFRSRILFDAVFRDETALLQSRQRCIDLPWLYIPIFFSASYSLKRRAQFVSMAWSLSK